MITDEQREARKLGIGGSDMPIILGLSNYKTPYHLYLEKKGLLDLPKVETEQQFWGNRLESVIRDEFAVRNNVIVDTPDTVIHPFHEFLRANVDGYIREWDSVLEVKCSSQFMANEWGDDGTDAIPMSYLVQVAHYCACLNAKEAHIAVLIGGHDYRQFKYTRDLELEDVIINAAKYFWYCVQNDTPPAATTIQDLRLQFPKHDPEKTLTINNSTEEQLTSLYDIRSKIKALEKQEEEARFNIMQYMETSECLTDIEGKPLVTWKSNKRGARTLLIK